uniref:NADH dehydrogenase subunit 2 n=1 Tax=Conopomorpha sinensis TaxID=940481 RepID=UPI001F132A4B|nr:NADH dehydrogenase subunit 2 [Conopomorpha sinensis]UIF93857.1 NADH dehydrogenase subunit 2 [Conopomorpha sinensis]
MYFTYNSNKMFFYFILMFSTLISISSNSWIGCWIGMEINLLSFIPLIINKNNKYSSEASLKYFLIQSIASINFLFLILMKMMILMNFEFNYFLTIMLNSTMLMKMGSSPFHFWFPIIIEGLSWLNAFFLMTWQKITPMILLSYYYNLNFIYIIIIINAIIGALGSINQICLRKMLSFSSINNLSWMLMSIIISENLWLMYFIIYSLLNLFLCYMFYYFNMFFFNQMFFFNLKNSMKMMFLMNFLSLGGLPPFLGFLPKWLMINFLMLNNMIIMNFILIMMSLIMLYFYIRISYSSLMFNYFKPKWFKMKIKNKTMILLNYFNFLTLLGLPISTFFFF